MMKWDEVNEHRASARFLIFSAAKSKSVSGACERREFELSVACATDQVGHDGWVWWGGVSM